MISPVWAIEVRCIICSTSAASVNNALQNPHQTIEFLGGRYKFKIYGKPATLRVIIQNVTNYYFWNMGYSPGFAQFSPHSAMAYLTADF